LASSFTCPRCGAVSHHPRDLAEGYCGRCHDWTGERRDSRDPINLRRVARAELSGDPEWAGLIGHARTCLVSLWCRDYVKVYDEVKRATQPR
jgi:hypothetical protein